MVNLRVFIKIKKYMPWLYRNTNSNCIDYILITNLMH